MLNRFTIIAFFYTILLLATTDANAALQGSNRAAAILCDVIMIIRGRYGRAIAVIALMSMATAFMLGNISWQKIATLGLGLALLFGAETVAYALLPATLRGVSGVSPGGKTFVANKYYTPEELVREVCPELSRY
jgi:type IV secretory pathway VirB2 component (pilin)